MFKNQILIFFICIVLFASCERVKNKGKQTIDKTKAAVAEKKDKLVDKVFTHYDANTPYTKWNKKRFEEFFKFSPTTDVKNIYCYADEFGIDHDYQFAFNCDDSSIKKIAANLGLNDTTKANIGRGLWHSFAWWDSAKIETLQPFTKKGTYETYWNLWYDEPAKKAYYFEFDM